MQRFIRFFSEQNKPTASCALVQPLYDNKASDVFLMMITLKTGKILVADIKVPFCQHLSGRLRY